MEHLIDAEHGPTALLASLVIVLTIHLLLRLSEFAFKVWDKKQREKETQIGRLITMVGSNTSDLISIKEQIDSVKKHVDALLGHSKKTEDSTRRIFTALKRIAGKNWPEIRKHMLEDEI